jgi:hypothetical protein
VRLDPTYNLDTVEGFTLEELRETAKGILVNLLVALLSRLDDPDYEHLLRSRLKMHSAKSLTECLNRYNTGAKPQLALVAVAS